MITTTFLKRKTNDFINNFFLYNNNILYLYIFFFLPHFGGTDVLI